MLDEGGDPFRPKFSPACVEPPAPGSIAYVIVSVTSLAGLYCQCPHTRMWWLVFAQLPACCAFLTLLAMLRSPVELKLRYVGPAQNWRSPQACILAPQAQISRFSRKTPTGIDFPRERCRTRIPASGQKMRPPHLHLQRTAKGGNSSSKYFTRRKHRAFLARFSSTGL